MSFRNRCCILGGNGIIQLSIPISGGRAVKSIMKTVMIDNNERWQDRHWKTIESCYNRSPFFEYYKADLIDLYHQKFDCLIDWNMKCLEWICDKLSIQTRVDLTDSWEREYNEEGFTDIRNKLTPASINRLNSSSTRYTQVFEDRFGFVPNLSILDKLFCEGPQAGLL